MKTQILHKITWHWDLSCLNLPNSFNFVCMVQSVKQVIVGIAVCMWGMAAWGQSRIQWGQEVKLRGGDFYSSVLSESDSMLYLLKLRTEVFYNDGFYADRFDARTLNHDGSVPLLLRDARIENEGRELVPQFEKVFVMDGTLCVFISAYDKATDENVAYAITYDRYNTQNGLVELDRIENAKRYNMGEFDFVLSPNGKKFMVLRKRPYQKKENARFDLKIFDSGFKQLYSKSVLLPYREKNFEVLRHALDDNGNVVLMARIEKENKEFLAMEPSYYFSLIEFAPADSNRVWEYDIPQEKKIDGETRILSDVDFILNERNEILVPGFYTTVGKEGTQGTFFMSVDRNIHQVKSSAFMPFEKTLVLDFINEKKYNRGQGLPGFNINYTVPLADGGLYVVSEQFYVSEVCGRDGRGFINCNYYYYYNSIVVFKIDQNGNIAWNAVVPKFQFSINDEGFYSSYALAVAGDKLHFIYNDHPKNINIQKVAEFKIMSKPSTSQAIHVTVNPDGTYIKEPLFSNKEEHLILRPKFSGQVRDGEIIVSAIPKNNYVKLGKITF